ncbi:MAG TPA: DUF5808 domain-containing protein [Bacteroidales bacterium]|nr:DUF5808 domain-containing protein [Bacteroidales bacterium]
MKKKLGRTFIDNMSKDPGNWKGPFYHNRKDPRLMVPKLYSSLGWTFNFASPYAYIALIAIIATIIVGVVIF